MGSELKPEAVERIIADYVRPCHGVDGVGRPVAWLEGVDVAAVAISEALRRSEPRGDDRGSGLRPLALASGGNREPEPGSAALAYGALLRIDQLATEFVVLAADADQTESLLGEICSVARTTLVALGMPGRGAASLEPRGCPTPGACSCPAPQSPDERARIICDFMGWTEEGPAWTDAHKLAASLSAGVSPGRRAMEGWRPTHRHVTRGTEYRLVAVAELQSAAPVAEGVRLAIYEGADCRDWARPLAEFNDGRFERLPAPAPTRDGADMPVEGEGR